MRWPSKEIQKHQAAADQSLVEQGRSNKKKHMASRLEVEVTVGSGSNLKNVNWRNGELQPYAVLWVDDGPKCSTRVDSGEDPVWDDKLVVPVPPSSAARLDDAVLYLDVVHAADPADDGVKSPLVGSARLPLRDVLDDAGIGGAKVSRSLRLKRPSGRPQGRVEVRVAVREAAPLYYDRSPYPAPAAYGNPYYSGQPYAAPPAGYPAGAGASYGAAAAPPPVVYGDPAYGGAAPQKSSKMGMGTGLAVGAAAGLLGGLALAELEDKFEDDVADKVEDDLYCDGDDDY